MTDEQLARQRILDAAQAAFLRHGTSGARMQDIADEAGVNKALLHYYFGSKEKLAEGVFQRGAQRLIPPVLQTLASPLPLEEKVRRAVDLYLDVLSATPDLPAYVLSEMHFHPERLESFILGLTGQGDRDFPERIFGALQEQIDAQVAAGTMRPIAARQFMVNLISLCVFPFAARPMLTFVLGGEHEDFERHIEERRRTLADFILGAMRP